MKRIETEIYVPSEEKKGCSIYMGQRKAKEVFQELSDALKEEGLYPDEYFILNSDICHSDEALFPQFCDIICRTSFGSSEGIYIDIDLLIYDEGEKSYKKIHLATGKTLDDSDEAFDRMQYITGYIYKLFRGDGSCYARYMIISTKSEKNRKTLNAKLEVEAIRLMKSMLFHGEKSPMEYAEELGLKMMILNALFKCNLSEEKIAELLAQKNILAFLSDKCGSIMAADAYELDDLFASCKSFKDLEVVK